MAEYIEREALLRYLNDIWLSAMPNDFMPDDDRQLAIVRCMGLNDAMDAIKSIPAADVRPVVRGVWNAVKGALHPAETSAVCSNCGFSTTIHAQTFYNFCPNCGADMREADNEKA
jgi:hypothetical protein